jgi:AraC-like DNA-binding protein
MVNDYISRHFLARAGANKHLAKNELTIRLAHGCRKAIYLQMDAAVGAVKVCAFRLMDYQLANTTGSTAIRFSTDAFPERDRAEMWQERRSQVVRLDDTPLTGHFRIEGVGMRLPGLAIVESKVNALRCARTRETMRDGNDNIRLVILKEAESPAIAVHLGRELIVEPGSAVVLSNCDLNAITFTGPRSRLFSLNLSRKTLRPLLHDFDAIFAQTIPNRIGALRLVVSYIEALFEQPMPLTHQLEQLAVAQIYDLAALTLGATQEAAAIASMRGLRAARLREVKSYITANLRQDALSVGEIANRQRVTSRYVQMLFEHEGTTFTEFVRDARLAQAHRMLVDKRLTHRSISAIAFDVGFGDLSYFNKVFRRRFGSSPSDVRATNARDA